MGFISNLAKGFVRSAVNQVGRDGGRVISNKLYKGNHATPIYHINNESNIYIQNDTNEKDFQYYKVDVQPSTFKYILIVLFSYCFFIVGPIITILRGFNRKNNRYMKVYTIKYESVYKPDARYKRGVRYEGKVETKDYTTVQIDDENKKINKKVGNNYIIIGTLFIVIQIIIVLLN